MRRLREDRLVDGEYKSIAVETLEDGRHGDTAKRWGCTCAGKTGCCGSSTLLRRAIFGRMRMT